MSIFFVFHILALIAALMLRSSRAGSRTAHELDAGGMALQPRRTDLMVREPLLHPLPACLPESAWYPSWPIWPWPVGCTLR